MPKRYPQTQPECIDSSHFRGDVLPRQWHKVAYMHIPLYFRALTSSLLLSTGFEFGLSLYDGASQPLRLSDPSEIWEFRTYSLFMLLVAFSFPPFG